MSALWIGWLAVGTAVERESSRVPQGEYQTLPQRGRQGGRVGTKQHCIVPLTNW